MSIKISIIIPFYNVDKYIKECLTSVVNQTLKDIEIICIDDCGDDSSLDICREFANNDPRVKIIQYSDRLNKGISYARNQGIAQAIGEYIWFLDSDDSFTSIDVLESVYNYAISMNASLVITDCLKTLPNIFDQSFYAKRDGMDNKVNKECFYVDDTSISSHPFSYYPWDKLYKRLILQENKILFNEEITVRGDIEYAWRVFLSDKFNIFYLPCPVVTYKVRNGSITKLKSKQSSEQALQSSITIINSIYNFLINNNKFERFQNSFKDIIKGIAKDPKLNSQNRLVFWNTICKENNIRLLLQNEKLPSFLYDFKLFRKKLISIKIKKDYVYIELCGKTIYGKVNS